MPRNIFDDNLRQLEKEKLTLFDDKLKDLEKMDCSRLFDDALKVFVKNNGAPQSVYDYICEVYDVNVYYTAVYAPAEV